jgi:hypothetical protein
MMLFILGAVLGWGLTTLYFKRPSDQEFESFYAWLKAKAKSIFHIS